MGGVQSIKPFVSFCLQPSVKNPTTREYKRVYAVRIDDGDLKLMIERCS